MTRADIKAIAKEVAAELRSILRTMDSTWVSPEEACKLLNVGDKTLRNMAKAGKIEANNSGRGRTIQYNRRSIECFNDNPS